jgi:serine/threonine-protein kinase RsbW
MTEQLPAEQFGANLARGSGAPRTARRLLKTWVGGGLERDQLDKAMLLVSELVSNAVLHGTGEMTLRASVSTDTIHVEVRDEGEGFVHALREPDETTAGGWGLQLVNVESNRWGVESGLSKVWFELDRDETSGSSKSYQPSRLS